MKQRILQAVIAMAMIFTVNPIAHAITIPQLNDELTGQPIGEGTRNLVICIHGWNNPPLANRYQDTGEWAFLVSQLTPVLQSNTSDRWSLLLYRWEGDANTGGLGFPLVSINAVQAALNSATHGISLGPRLPASLRRVHFITHSAGAWCAYRAAYSLKQLNPYVIVQVTLLDPFMPNETPQFSGQYPDYSKAAISGMKNWSTSSRFYLLENYYADDLPPGLLPNAPQSWLPVTTVGTQETFSWRPGDVNLQVEWDPDLFHPPGINRYYDWHSGPTLFYADTVAAAALGTVSSRLPPNSPPYVYQAYGWYNSLFHRSYPQWASLPRITTQPQNKSVVSGASVTLSVQGSSILPLSYQWFKHGQASPLPGATGASYTFTASFAGAGDYVVRVSDSTGTIFSDFATVTVTDAPPPTTAPAITSVSPSTLPPSFSTQLINIYGSNFKASGDPNVSTLIFRDPANIAYPRTPIFVSSSQLQYNITVQTAVGTWSVTVTNAGQAASNLKTFLVETPPPNTGSLTINLSPSGAVSAGAQWRVDGGSYRNTGDTATGLTPGSHTVSFKSVPGYTTPADKSVSITSGVNTADSGTYNIITPSTYTLTINYNPTQGGASPSPLVPQTSSTYGSYSFGYTANAVTLVQASASTGYHFTGWSGDASGSANPITITMNGNKNITANFAVGDPNMGTMVVTIVPPEAAAAGVTWGFNESDFRVSGTSLQYWPGTYLIYVNGANGWIGYPSWVTVVAGQTTNVSLPASSTTGSIIGSDPRNYHTFAGLATNSGSADGVGSAARFYRPWSLAVDKGGNVYVADSWNALIRKISPLGEVTTVAGKVGVNGFADGQGTNAIFNNPTGIAVDGSTNLYVADFMNSVIRKITPDGTVSTFAGQAGINDSVDANGNAARFYFPAGVVADINGNIYVADSVNQTIRKITPGRDVTTLAGFPRSFGSADGTGSAARFHNPTDVAVDASGNVYVADNVKQTIRKVTPAGVVTTLAGFPGSSGAADGTGNVARFNNVSGVAVDNAGNIYVADTGNNCIRKVTQGGVVTTVAGQSGIQGNADGIGSLVRFRSPSDVAVDGAGNLFIVDAMNHTIRTTQTSATKFDQTITFGALPDKYINDLPFALTATASSVLPVAFSVVSGPVTLSNNTVTIMGAGTVTVRAAQAGNSTFNPATNVDRSFVVAKLPQTITFGALSRQVVGDAPFALLASASSGLPVSYSVLSGPAILSGNIVTMTGPGLAVLRASQSGDATNAPAPNVDQVLLIVPGNNVITDAQRLANGMFTMRFYGDTGTNYVVKASTNLVNWLPIATNQISGLGYLEFTDISSTNFDRRFYLIAP